MQYTTKVLIEKPLQEVIKKINSFENLKHWHDGLVSTEHISGTPGQFGSKLKLNYYYGKRKVELIETITKHNLPSEIHVTYSTKGMVNIQENYFETSENDFTYWVSKNDFQPTTFSMNAMLFLMPMTFRKQTKNYMTNFKRFVENGTSLYNA
jgi:hypothetical protein